MGSEPGNGLTADNDDDGKGASVLDTGDDSAEPVSTSTFRKLSNLLGLTISDEKIKEFGYNSFIKDNCYDYPPGTPRLARFITNSEWSIYRRFEYLHNRIILQLELELTELEKELAELDKKDAAREEVAWAAGLRTGPEFRLRIPVFDQEPPTEQMKLLENIRIRIKKYDELVYHQYNMQNLPQASGRNHCSYFNYIRTSKPKKMLFSGYDDHSFHVNDFVTTTGSGSNLFRELIKDSWVERLLPAKVVKNGKDGPEVTIYSQKALNIVTFVTSVSICVGVILIPVSVLFLVPMSGLRMAITTSVCIIPFASLLFLVTNDLYQVFIGTAMIQVMIMFLGTKS